MQTFVPHGFNHFSAANSQHGSTIPFNSLSGQVSMSMLESDTNLWHALFAHLTQHCRNASLEDVKSDFFPILLHKVQRLAGLDPSGAQHILQFILEHSDVSEVLLMRCFDQVLQQRIAEARTCMSDSSHEIESLTCDVHACLTHLMRLRAKSEAGSAKIQTPTPEVESIIRDLLCGRVEEAAAAFRSIQCDSRTQISRGSAPLLPLRDKTHEATPAEMQARLPLMICSGQEPIVTPKIFAIGHGNAFARSLYDSTMYSPPDNKKLLDAFTNVKCQEPGTPEQVTTYTNLYMHAFQDLRRH
jgi:hypothetical protein